MAAFSLPFPQDVWREASCGKGRESCLSISSSKAFSHAVSGALIPERLKILTVEHT